MKKLIAFGFVNGGLENFQAVGLRKGIIFTVLEYPFKNFLFHKKREESKISQRQCIFGIFLEKSTFHVKEYVSD